MSARFVALALAGLALAGAGLAGAGPAAAEVPPPAWQKGHRFFVGAVGSIGQLGGPEYDGSAGGGLEFGWYLGSGVRLGVQLLEEEWRFVSGSPKGRDLQYPGFGELALTARYDPSGAFTGMQPIVGISAGGAAWDYSPPVVRAGEATVTDYDYVDAFSVFAGAGRPVGTWHSVHADLNAVAGAHFYGNRLTESHRPNDLFGTTGFVRVGVELTSRVVR